MTKQEDINTIKDCIASWMRQRDEMVMRYQNALPSHVRAHLDVLEERIELYKAKLAEMEGETE